MASATLDVVLAMESKLRTNVKSDALRWNATSQQFERFDGSAWTACVDVPSDVVHKAGAETITGAKTFSGGLSGSLTGNVTGNCSGSSGSCTGNAATATTLATARALQTNLASSTAASFDGSAGASIGVTGVLPVANGGTGATSLSSITVGNATTSASCTGNSATATQATKDGAGNVIASTAYVPVGTVIWSMATSVPTGFLLCDGSNLSRTTYASLFSAIGTTYGSGDGSTTFGLPNLMNKFLEGASSAGTSKAAGLPEIYGNVCDMYAIGQTGSTHVVTYEGALMYSIRSGFFATNSGSYISHGPLEIRASWYNSIYGNSTTVQPPALTALPCIKY